jgi:hypothetical protein
MKIQNPESRIKNKKGAILTLTLVFGGILLLLISGLLGFILLQLRQSQQKLAWENSLHIAEAGINYYRWHLNHTPKDENPDIQDGNDWCCKVEGIEYGQNDPQCQEGDFTACGTCDGQPCYEHDYIDPETDQSIGKFILEIKAKKICGKILGVYIYSTGFTDEYPDLERKVVVKFASTSIGEYGSIIDEAVWRAEEEATFGKFHTNQGMRMDASNNSLVTSEASEWICTYSYGCSGSDCPEGCVPEGGNCRCEGICGAGEPKDLWEFPSFHFDFPGLTNDLNGMRDLAEESETDRGKDMEQHFPPSGEKGYHIIFHDDRSFDIKKVTAAEGIPSAFDIKEMAWITSYEVISNETDFKQGVTLPPECGLIFIEDNLWVEGTIKGKITVAAAVPENDLINPTVFIVGDLDYTTLDGSDSLALIGEENILITRGCSDQSSQITTRGVFIAQKGYFGRRGYAYGPWDERVRERLLTYGTIVSEIRGEVTYLWGSGNIFSGFQTWDCYFDPKQARDPPPLLPCVSPELQLISWEEL